MPKKRAGKKPSEVFDWSGLLFAGMVFARGVMSDDPRVQKTCGEILDDLTEPKPARKPAKRQR